MAIVNRDLDQSQQREVVDFVWGALATGVTVGVWIAPFPCTIQAVRHAAYGISGSPLVALHKMRGVTPEAIGISSIVLQAMGTSGSLGFSGLAATGSTLLNLDRGNVVFAVSSGSNSAVTQLQLSLIVKKIEDIVKHF